MTPKEESFAVALASGQNIEDAYLGAYSWKGTRRAMQSEASKVANRPHVLARIQELRDAYATKVVEASRGMPAAEPARAFGVKEAMEELDEAANLAKLKENPGALAKVVEVRMKLYGLGVSDAKNPKDKEEVPPEELEAMLATLQAMKAMKDPHAKPGTTH